MFGTNDDQYYYVLYHFPSGTYLTERGAVTHTLRDAKVYTLAIDTLTDAFGLSQKYPNTIVLEINRSAEVKHDG